MLAIQYHGCAMHPASSAVLQTMQAVRKDQASCIGASCTQPAQAERLVAQFEEAGIAIGDLGLAFLKIAKYEDEEGARTGAYTDSSAAARDISANTKRVGMVRARHVWAGFSTAVAPSLPAVIHADMLWL